MARLQQLILRLGCASLSEVNRAIFAYPEHELIEALASTLGEERAAAIRESVAQSLKLPLIADADIRIDDSVLHVSALQLTPLVSRYKALPLRREMEGNSPVIVLAMSNPLNVEARSAFSRLYQLPVKACMAREKAIVTTFALASAKLSQVARVEAKERSELLHSGTAKLIEDPESWKALQQLVATAVKHHVREVLITVSGAPMRGEFRFADGHVSKVEVQVDPLLVIAALLRRGQVIDRVGRTLTAQCRVRFKSVSVTLVLSFVPDGEFAPGDLVCGTAILRDFSVESIDNPCFWLGMSEGTRDSIHRMLGEGEGILVVACARQPVREFALKSIGESYDDAEIVDGLTSLVTSDELFERAKTRRILVGLDVSDEFVAFEQLAKLSPAMMSAIRGVVGYQQISRLCEFCAHPASLNPGYREAFVRLPVATLEHYAAAPGCRACGGVGMIGFWGLTAALELTPVICEAISGKRSVSDLRRYLAEIGFQSLFEDAVSVARRGIVGAPQVMDQVVQPPDEFLRAKMKGTMSRTNDLKGLLSLSIIPIAEENGDPLPEVSWDAEERPADAPPEERAPIRGRSVFMTAPKDGAAPEHESVRQPVKAKESKPAASGVRAAVQGTPGQKAAAPKEPLILVIDDDPDQRSILRRVFELAGYRVEVAADGIDGIVTAVRHEPSVIVVDFMMPELDGRETVKRLKAGAGTAHIPIVALTAYADPDVELGLLQAGADDFCPKSISKQVLLKRIQRLLPAP